VQIDHGQFGIEQGMGIREGRHVVPSEWSEGQEDDRPHGSGNEDATAASHLDQPQSVRGSKDGIGNTVIPWEIRSDPGGVVYVSLFLEFRTDSRNEDIFRSCYLYCVTEIVSARNPQRITNNIGI
jgi:hypothetical protein